MSQARVHPSHRNSVTARRALTALAMISVTLVWSIAGQSSVSSAEPTARYAVFFDEDSTPDAAVRSLGARALSRVRQRYRRVWNGFAADLTAAEADSLQHRPGVRAVVRDGRARIADGPVSVRAVRAPRQPAQSIPTGVARCGARLSATARINKIEDPMPVDVAIVDTGVDASHPDLNVVGGFAAVGGTFADGNGHGTHIAGIVGARDNRIGVVGVAPGARLWAVRVLGDDGTGFYTDIAAGLEFVVERSDTIRIANLSLTGDLADSEVLRAAVQACQAAGVTVIAAAGNTRQDVAGIAPASFEGVIAVSALADKNGKGGKSAGIFRVGATPEKDESFAYFSNFGAGIALMAPGCSIKSTLPGGGYGSISGTSQSTAHVSGAAALYLKTHPGAMPAEIRAALVAAGDAFSPMDDTDGFREPLLNVSTF